MIRFLLFFFSLCLTLAAAEPATYPAQVVKHRVAADGSESLLTPVARYVDAAGRTVDLVGAIHLGDARYYRALNRAFPRYDKVLYEMVDGEGVPEMLRLARKVGQGTATAEEAERFDAMVQQNGDGEGNLFGNMISHYYVMMSQLLDLRLQMEIIDYSLPNMVFADMSSEELSAAMKQRGESWLRLILASMFEESGSTSLSVLSMDAVQLRRTMIRALATESGSSLEHSAIVVSRNERCMEVLDRELATAPGGTQIAVFYGAMHLRDMHSRMLARGFRLQGVQWISAIRA